MKVDGMVVRFVAPLMLVVMLALGLSACMGPAGECNAVSSGNYQRAKGMSSMFLLSLGDVEDIWGIPDGYHLKKGNEYRTGNFYQAYYTWEQVTPYNTCDQKVIGMFARRAGTDWFYSGKGGWEQARY